MLLTARFRSQSYTGRLASQAIKQLIRETLNRHRLGQRPAMALVGSRRSGSTLLMQAIGSNRGVKWVNQPFAPFSGPPHQVARLPHVSGGQYLGLSAQEEAKLESYVEDIISGRLHVDEPWRVWRHDFHFRSDRVVFKTTNAHFLEAFLVERLGVQVLRYFRHPLSQSLSCLQNGWGDLLDAFGKSHIFQTVWMTSKQRELFLRVHDRGTPLERHVLSWCCENLPLLQTPGSHPELFYEELVTNPGPLLDKVARNFELGDVTAMKAVMNKPSYSARRHSTKEMKKAVVIGDKQTVLEGWMHRVSPEDLTAAKAILDAFEVEHYRVDSARPCASSLEQFDGG